MADHLELCPFRENEGQSIDAEKKNAIPNSISTPTHISFYIFTTKIAAWMGKGNDF